MPIGESLLVFLATLLATLTVAYIGRRHESALARTSLSSQGLNKWMVGLSAGATANSGFVVTAAVGLGYADGMRWVLLPLAWLLGDLVFWSVFPHRINRIGAQAQAATLTDVIAYGASDRGRLRLKRIVGIIVLGCLGGYVSAQWLAGQKFMAGAFGLDQGIALVFFAALIVTYSALGGFRGSVYADTLQAGIRVVGTAVAMIALAVTASSHGEAFWIALRSASPSFLHLLPEAGLPSAIGFVVGYASAALGFGLGQPQIVTRYLAGKSPSETRDAQWIYIGFVQSTWIAMTLFGVGLRGVMPSLADPEMGLSVFHRTTTGPLVTGIITADIFATIASTANSILVAMAQTLRFDLLARKEDGMPSKSGLLWLPVAVFGGVTMLLSQVLHGTVVDSALVSVSLMGAGLAPAMMVRLLGWRHTDRSLIASIVAGFTAACLWRLGGLQGIVNEATVGILAGLLTNLVVVRWVPVDARGGAQARQVN